MNNLLVVRAGDHSLHEKWLHTNFDFAISYYGDQPGRYADDATIYECRKGGKWDSIADFCRQHSGRIAEYDFIGFPDDDLLEGDPGTFGICLEIGEKYRLDLFQPALTPESPIFWPHLKQHPWKMLRYCNFVEIQAPIMSRRAFEILLPTFDMSGPLGRGLDALWPQMLPWPDYRCAVVDAFPMIHTRPTGTGDLYGRNAPPENQDSSQADRLQAALLATFSMKWPEYEEQGFVPLWVR